MEGDEEGNNDKETTKTFLYCMKLKERLSISHEHAVVECTYVVQLKNAK